MNDRTPFVPGHVPTDDAALLAGIYDALPDAVVFADTEHRVRFVNSAFRTLLGRGIENLAGRPVSDLFHSEYEEDRAVGERILASCRTVDDCVIPVESAISEVLLEGRRIGYVHRIRDVSDQRLREQRLLAARDAAEEATARKDEFLAKVSHEIRAPMSGVIGMTSVLLDTALSQTQREYAESILGSGENLLRLIDDLLDLSKIEAGKLEIEPVPFDPYHLVGEVVDLFAPQADAKAIRIAHHLDASLPAEVVGDPYRLRQVIVNLVSNAVKFTDEGEVVVRVHAVGVDEESIQLSVAVSDTGIGIAAEQRRSLFQPFSQADVAIERKYGGTGLGLAITKQLVELMGGSISIESAPNTGSTFSFTIALGCTHAEPPCVQRDEALVGVPILLVDSNAKVRDVTASYLRHWQMEVYAAADGAQAVAHASRLPIQIALINAEMGDVTGIALAEQLARAYEPGALKLILLTRFKDRVLSDDLRDAGFDACVAQPVWPHRLRSAIAAVLNHPVEPAAAVSVPQEADRRWGRILLVEDNAVNQRVAGVMLRNLGYEVEIAVDGAAAVGMLERSRFDAILMDCQMPGMDGFETTRRIRELTGERARTPIIALTANAMKGDRERCLKAGMNDYLSKPFRPDAIRETLDRWITEFAEA